MADNTLREFVREALAKGQSRKHIESALRKAGWPDDQIADALAGYADVDFPVPVPRPRRFGGAREAFLYIVFFSLLGVFSIQLGAVAFAFIDSLFADPLERGLQYGAASRLRWSIASLVVGYPIFVYLGWRLSAARRKDPERRVSRVRAWLTYVTLIFAALVLIGDLVAVVYNFLGGELQSRFLAKAGVVGVISGAILWNYTRDAERTTAGADWAGRLLAILTTLVTVALVIWAFTRVDTPNEVRLRAFDQQRMDNLHAIARRVDCHRTYFGATPENLTVMEEALKQHAESTPVAAGCAGETPSDPATDAPYRYEALEGDEFRLCATFARGWPEDEDEGRTRPAPHFSYVAGEARRTLQYPKAPGETCFDLEAIDFEKEDDDPAPALE